MTDRYAGFVVTLERNLRSDDAQPTIAAIRQIKGVVDVKPVPVSIETAIAEDRVRRELETKIWDALHR